MVIRTESFFLSPDQSSLLLGITSPPYRRTLYEWFELITPHLPQCCQRTIRRQSKSIQTRTTRFQTNTPQQVRISIKNDQQILMSTFDDINTPKTTIKDGKKNNRSKECTSLLPR